jgi:putative hydrolase of the HAD superfamily
LVPASLWGAIHSGQLDGEGIRREICRVLGVDLSEEEFRRDWNSHFTVNREILPFVESLIGRVKVLLLSNTNAIHMAYLMAELPLLRRFDDLVLSHEVKKMKPDPAIFEEALRRAGSVPSRTAFFDDVPEFVEAAKKVGLRAYVFRSVDEFAAQLEELGLR